MEPEVDLGTMDRDELTAVAAGRDLWLKAPAIGELGRRFPAAAGPIAAASVHDPDDLVASTGLRVWAHLEPEPARRYMTSVVDSCSTRMLEMMVENIAVDDPVADGRWAVLLAGIARRLRRPESDTERYLAELFFGQYPELHER